MPVSFLNNFRHTLRWKRQFNAVRQQMDETIRLVNGIPPPPLTSTDMLVILLVQNGAHQIESFIEHHLHLGARHIVLLDNGSTDQTIELASKHKEISIFSAPLPYQNWEHFLKAWAGFHFSSNGWILYVDVDERFDYPYSNQCPLPAFLRYLNQHNYSVVQSQMLDLFSLEPASGWPQSGHALENECVWYDLEDVHWKPARKKRRNAFGGIRKTAFGIDPKLTKYPLLKWSAGGWPSLKSSHSYSIGRPADLITLLRHYKFDRSFIHQCADFAKRENHWNGSFEYKHYLKTMQSSTDFRFAPKNPKQLNQIEQLIQDGFIDTSERYLRYAKETTK